MKNPRSPMEEERAPLPLCSTTGTSHKLSRQESFFLLPKGNFGFLYFQSVQREHISTLKCFIGIFVFFSIKLGGKLAVSSGPYRLPTYISMYFLGSRWSRDLALGSSSELVGPLVLPAARALFLICGHNNRLYEPLPSLRPAALCNICYSLHPTTSPHPEGEKTASESVAAPRARRSMLRVSSLQAAP